MYKKTPQCQVKGLVDLYHSCFGYIEDGFFVDVGAFNGYNWSNTYCLAEVGWSGILVEPHPDYFKELQILYKDNPKLSLINVCVGLYNASAKLYLGGSNSTTKSEMIDIYNDIEWSKFSGLNEDNFLVCQLFTLDTMLKAYNCPFKFEVLSIDVEGAEIDILLGFTVREWWPKMVIIETHEKNEDKRLAEKSNWINVFFEAFEYEKIYSDHINSVYVK